MTLETPQTLVPETPCQPDITVSALPQITARNIRVLLEAKGDVRRTWLGRRKEEPPHFRNAARRILDATDPFFSEKGRKLNSNEFIRYLDSRLKGTDFGNLETLSEHVAFELIRRAKETPSLPEYVITLFKGTPEKVIDRDEVQDLKKIIDGVLREAYKEKNLAAEIEEKSEALPMLQDLSPEALSAILEAE